MRAAGNTGPAAAQRRACDGAAMAAPRTLLLTRPRAQSAAFAEVLAERLPGRFRPVLAPLIEIVALPAPLDLERVQGLIFTSANGVEQFAARTPDRSLPAWCVGAMTAAAARQAGLAARSADGDVADLAALVAREHRPGAGDFLHLRGAHATGDLIGRLTAAGVPARAAEIYDQAPRPLSEEARDLLARGRIDVLTFFSPRTARLFAAEAAGAGWDLSRTVAVSLSAAADAAFAGPAPASRRIAATPTRDGMLAALKAIP
jgi:uroporphyrinogen-III synthase